MDLDMAISSCASSQQNIQVSASAAGFAALA